MSKGDRFVKPDSASGRADVPKHDPHTSGPVTSAQAEELQSLTPPSSGSGDIPMSVLNDFVFLIAANIDSNSSLPPLKQAEALMTLAAKAGTIPFLSSEAHEHLLTIISKLVRTKHPLVHQRRSRILKTWGQGALPNNERKAPSEAGADSAPSLKTAHFGKMLRELTHYTKDPISPKTLMNAVFAPALQGESGVTLYNVPGQEVSLTPPPRPLKIAFLTSVRDVGVGESVGKCETPGDKSSYIKGTIETALEAVNDSRLGRFADVVAIITDDLEKDLKGSDYVADPNQDGAWILPRDARNQRGELASSLTVNIPSKFRSLSLHAHEERQAAKLDFESKVFHILQESSADILISDHFLARIDYLISPDHFNCLGKVLNTHPGITRADHPYPTLGKFTYQLMRLHANGLKRLPDNTVISVPHHNKGGASFHFVTSGIDRGPVLCDGEFTTVSWLDTEQDIVRKMYETSKYHVFLEGVRHYASNIYPLMFHY